MTHDSSETRWREALKRQAADDAGRAPNFDLLWRAAQQRTHASAQPSPWMRPAFSAVALSVVIVGLAVCMMRSPLPSDDEALAMASALSAWQAPTDTLLTSTATAMPAKVPAFTIESIRLTALTNNQTEVTNASTQEISP